MRSLLILIALAAVLGCHLPQPVHYDWFRTDGAPLDAAQFQRDAIDCEAQTRAGAQSFIGAGWFAGDMARDFELRCMNARGYALTRVADPVPSLSEQWQRTHGTGGGPTEAECRTACEQLAAGDACFANCTRYR